MLLIPYNSSTLPFPDHPYSTYRLHLALALLTHMGLIEFDRCVLDPTTPWKFYLKHLQSEKCEKTFLVLRHFHQILPHFMLDIHWKACLFGKGHAALYQGK